ncbi:MAG: hypothetical protein EBR28_10560, partial [Planctomycetia bacterium]|nr:hypothetical protein [Planctomycetia bacterium]
VASGSGWVNGSAYGSDLFVGVDTTFQVTAGQTLAIGNLGGAGNVADPTVSAKATDPNVNGGLIKTGAGTLMLTGTSYYSGLTTVNLGTLALASGAMEQGTTVVTVGQNAGDVATLALLSGSRLTLGGFNGTSGTDAALVIAQDFGSTGTVVIGSGPGTSGADIGARVFTGGAGNATVQFTQQYAAGSGTNSVYPFSTTLTGTLGLVQAGVGTTQLEPLYGANTFAGVGTTQLEPLYGANTFAGPVTVNSGTLATTGTAAALAGAEYLFLNQGGVLALGQTQGVRETAAVSLQGGTLRTATSLVQPFGPLAVTGSTSVIDFLGDSSLGFSSLSLGGQLSIWHYSLANDFLNIATGTATGSLAQIAFYSDAGTTYLGEGGFAGTRLVPVAVPEPSTLALALAAIACTAWGAARHRRRQLGAPGCMLVALAGLAGTGVAHAQQPVVIPLTQTSQRFEIYVGVNGGPAFPYMFDTGSQIFEASQTVLASTTVSGTLATGVVEQYVDNGFVYDVVTVNSIQFYASGSATAPVVSLDAGGGGFRMGSVTGTFSGTNSATATPVNTPAFMAPYCGIFGAGSFTSLVSGSVAIGSIFGQATTTGWVVAGNGPSSATPAVVLGLDATLRSGFTSGTNAAVYNWISGTAPFPVSNAASSAKNAVVMNLAVQSGTAAVAWSAPALFDTGTPTNNLRPDPATLEALQTVNAISTGTMNGSLTDYLSVGATLAVTGTAGGFSYAPPLESFDTVTSYGYPPWVFPVYSSGTDAPTTTLGLGFFLTNSVMYDLENGQIGVTTAYVVPEPPGCWMASVGLACGGVVMWRRRRRVGDQGSSLVSIRRCMR